MLELYCWRIAKQSALLKHKHTLSYISRETLNAACFRKYLSYSLMTKPFNLFLLFLAVKLSGILIKVI